MHNLCMRRNDQQVASIERGQASWNRSSLRCILHLPCRIVAVDPDLWCAGLAGKLARRPIWPVNQRDWERLGPEWIWNPTTRGINFLTRNLREVENVARRASRRKKHELEANRWVLDSSLSF